MKSLIIFSVLIGAFFYHKGQGMMPPITLIDETNCTYTGADCPDVPCCFAGFKCRLAGLSLYNRDFSGLSVIYNKTWMCLNQVNFGEPCQYHEECMHIKNVKCINLTCQCENNFFSYFPDDEECR